MSKKITNKIIIALLIILLFNFTFTPLKANAISAVSIISKPIVTLGITVVDLFNCLLTVLLGDVGESVDEVKNALESDDGNKLAEIGDLVIDPSKIFAGKVPMLNANIFEAEDDTKASVGGDSLVVTLKKVTAGTYEMVRNLCAIVMLVLLIYTGIRIVLASNSANERAKWQMVLLDWVKGLALVIFVHLIMIGVFWISDKLVLAISGATNSGDSFLVAVRYAIIDELANWNGATLALWMLFAMYVYITYLTIVFAIAYLKRLMYVILLIIIAPIVAVMYALGGQQKQIFSRWLKEYIMAVLLQPYHMLIYYILLSMPLKMLDVHTSAGNIFTGNNLFQAIYALVAMSFIRPAETMFRDMFGFNMGVARMGSFDSGKATLDAGKKAVKDVAMVVGGAVTGNVAMAANGLNDLTNGGLDNAKEMVSAFKGAPEEGETEGEGDDSTVTTKTKTETKVKSGDGDESETTVTTTTTTTTTLEGEGEKEEKREELDAAEKLRARIESLEVGTITADTVKGLEGEIGSGDERDRGIDSGDGRDRGIDSGDGKGGSKDEDKGKKDGESTVKDQKAPFRWKDATKEEKNKYLAQKIKFGLPQNLVGVVKDKVPGRKLISGVKKKINDKVDKNDILAAGRDRVRFTINWLRSEDGTQALANAEKSLGNLRNTMYLPGQSPGDTPQYYDNRLTNIKTKNESTSTAFIENDNNIEFVKKKYGLEDNAYSTANEQARAILQDASKFTKYGVKDVGVATTLLDYKKEKGLSYEDAVDKYGRSDQNAEVGAFNKFVGDGNTQNFRMLFNIIAESRGHDPEVLRANPESMEYKQIATETYREVQAASPYLASGAADKAMDVYNINRLAEQIRKNGGIEDKDGKIEKIVAATDRVVKRALKDGTGIPAVKGISGGVRNVAEKELSGRKAGADGVTTTVKEEAYQVRAKLEPSRKTTKKTADRFPKEETPKVEPPKAPETPPLPGRRRPRRGTM